ncbi:MAG TPA: ATPase domain-containing protein [Steroidobacteraceae bacterium]
MIAEGAPRLRTGVAGLDEVLHGGLLAQRLYLVDGNPGCGKTTFALQFLLEGVKRGEKCLYVTLSETREELEAGAASHGWSLEALEVVELTADQQQDLLSEGPLTMVQPSDIELSETTRRILDVIDRVAPTRMVFDSLSEMRLLARNSLLYRRQILALKQYLVGRRCGCGRPASRCSSRRVIAPASLPCGKSIRCRSRPESLPPTCVGPWNTIMPRWSSSIASTAT